LNLLIPIPTMNSKNCPQFAQSGQEILPHISTATDVEIFGFLMVTLFLALLHLLFVLIFTSGEIVNLVTHQPVTNIWFEVGFAKISNVDWVSISTFQTTFSKPLIFISHPDLSSTANFPAVPRLRNILQTGGKVSFQTKLYLPNDSYCSKQWYIPQYIQPAKQASWAVFEYGAYNVSGRPLYLSDGPIYRLSSSGMY
jgi:hypothetical protein